MNTNAYILAAIAICAAVTLLLRLAPFLLFGGKQALPPFLQRLAARMPAAIIAVLVVYCLRGTVAQTPMQAGASFAALTVVVALHLWRRNTLLSIAGGTAVYMLLLRLI